jgi:hypothetical protein
MHVNYQIEIPDENVTKAAAVLSVPRLRILKDQKTSTALKLGHGLFLAHTFEFVTH